MINLTRIDLRIKNGTDLYAAKSISYEGNIAGDAVVTPHVAAKAVSSGIQFDITCPTDPCYSQGFGTVLIYRIENDENTTGATLDSWYKSGTLSFVYPLCEAGEAYRFKVQIEPTDLNNNRDFQYYEYIDITAKGGIGDINYSNINARKWVTAGYANNAPTVKIENCIPPDAKDVKTYVAFFAGNGDWETNNATVWFDYYSAPGIEFTINPDADWINGFTYAINSTGKDRSPSGSAASAGRRCRFLSGERQSHPAG